MDFSNFLETLFENKNSSVAKDLKLNLKKFVEGGALDKTEAHLALLATATSVSFLKLIHYAKQSLAGDGIPADQILEAEESASIMAMLNVYYRFRHMVGHNQPEAAEAYKISGLRMTSLAKPALGKGRFEMLAFAVSVLNGCENCISSHEKTLRDAGVSTEKIHDLARLAACVKAWGVFDAIHAVRA
jgi:alkyl hydroperoxide reductase subunit D